MMKFQGKGVYGAIAVGKVSLFRRQETQVRRVHADPASELERLEKAKTKATEQLSAIYEKALVEVGETNAQIFEIHMMMLEDDDYNESISSIIQTQNVNAEYAVAVTADNFAEMFSSMDDAYMQARASDVRDISNRLIVCLSDSGSSSSDTAEKTVICADDLAPSETVSLDKDKVLALECFP
ncbi:phosphoenolpyruvate-utilizing N-terminal domain-containing protein [Ruminococcus flavefaciens]|uniref:phosphoenolpyruvate-utilizing N-terminal domain-containing protein n=1 Tax=Ruminococcus flavefaciens TaxID=1265 RepID=UPI0015674CA6|nr:phosphoenolpyruvate-utilizing N-terminal domain-containing protein [Ruminococcus flavefaciens]